MNQAEQDPLYDDGAGRRPPNPYYHPTPGQPDNAGRSPSANPYATPGQGYQAGQTPFPQPTGNPYQAHTPNQPPTDRPENPYGNIQNPYTQPYQPPQPPTPTDPYGDFRRIPNQPSRRTFVLTPADLTRPRWTYIFAAMCVAVFVGQVATGLLSNTRVLDSFMRVGVLYKPAVLDGEWWRVITPIFLHWSIIHILFNMLALVSFGALLEQWFGTKWFIVTFFLTGIAGNLLTLLVANPATQSAGASGAIFGILGAAIGFFYRHQNELPGYGRGVLQNLLINAGINLVFTLSIPNISVTGHLGGFAAGLFLGYFLSPLWKRKALGEGREKVVNSAANSLAEWWPVAVLVAVEVAVYFISLQTNLPPASLY